MNRIVHKMLKPPSECGPVKPSARPLTVLVATFFGTGHLPVASGTWASLAAAIAAYFLLPADTAVQLIVALVVLLIGVPVSRRAEEIYGKDAGPIVIDETAGMLITLIAVPKTIPFYFAAFLLFRFFDIFKPFPARRSEKLPNGWGVMMDDIISGIYGLAAMHLIIFIIRETFKP
jgi:phosphatidylglycerophosphatase A